MRRDVPDDAALYRAAGHLADRRVKTAAPFAARRAQSLLNGGIVAGAMMRRRLLSAVRQVQRGLRRGESIN